MDNNKPNYDKFNDDIIHNILDYKMKEYDFQLKFDFIIELVDIIILFKEYLLKLKKKIMISKFI